MQCQDLVMRMQICLKKLLHHPFLGDDVTISFFYFLEIEGKETTELINFGSTQQNFKIRSFVGISKWRFYIIGNQRRKNG